MKNKPTEEQEKILSNNKKNLIVSASAGSGKTFVVIEYLINLICEKKVPLSRLLVLTFTKAAANEMKTRLYKAILEKKPNEFLLNQLDDINLSDISTIDAFCEKLIKRNINKLNIDENFNILDTKLSQNLKFIAFNRIFETFSENNQILFDEIYFAFKKNKQQIFETMLNFQSFFESSFNGGELIDEFIENSIDLEIKAEKYINNYIKNELKIVKNNIFYLFDLPEAYENFKNNLLGFCEINLDDDLIENFNKLNNFKLASIPRNKIENIENKKILAQNKEKLKNIQKITENYTEITENLINKFKNNNLINALLSFYKDYNNEYQSLKASKSSLDFSDLEIIAKSLLEDDEVAQSLQDKYDYIFIDEYQDTNTLQEAIIKPIAKKGSFVAVGDPKQGIYGFRNASMEIMKKDIEDFSKDQNSDALFLTGNFRSDQRLLSFINDIFIKVMTEETVGIDYEKTSKLKGLQKFEKGKMPAVRVDIIASEKEKEKVPEGVYSVKEDSISLSKENLEEVKTIAMRIEEALQSEIFDAKQQCFRKVKEGDIAVLFRGRSAIMQETVRFLQEKGFNIVADIKQNLLEDSEIGLLLSLFKLTCNMKDDISLVSVMNSWIGGFTLDEVTSLRLTDKTKSFYEIVEESNDERVAIFKGIINNFSFDIQVLGLTKAIYKLFIEKDFNAYLNTTNLSNIKKGHITELFKIIKSSDYEYNVAGLINHLENIETQGSMSEHSANAITLTTIHATKGLEYPIVILAGAGEKLAKIYNKPYNISKEFGLGTYLYDYDENIRILSPVFLANKLYKQRKEFIDELMIFYVALTRAQNHLFIVGSSIEKDVTISNDVFDCQNYLDIILSSFGENFASNLFSQEHIKTENWEFTIIDKVIEEDKEIISKNNITNLSNALKDEDKIKSYIDYIYNEKEKCYYSYKNSVSSVLRLEESEVYEDVIIKSDTSLTEEEILKNEKNKLSREKAILRGNAYHEALRVIDFDRIKNKTDLENYKEYLQNQIGCEYFEMLDIDILYKNIILVKKTIGKNNAIKERQFIMETSLKEAGIADSDKQVIIQGIVDLFALGEKTILIDYKFTSIKEENKLIEKYKKQIDLYALAIEKAFDIKLDEKYLISLKNAQLIRLK